MLCSSPWDGVSVLLLLIVAALRAAARRFRRTTATRADKAKPWKKAKTLKFDEKNEAKAEGELSYRDYKRAAWFAADLAEPGQLDLKLEITPPGDGTNEEFDLGFEVLDPGNRVIAQLGPQEGDDAGEIQKTKSLLDLEPGKYLVHLYLQGRHGHGRLRAARGVQADVDRRQERLPGAGRVRPRRCRWCRCSDDTPKSYKPPAATVVAKKPPAAAQEAPPKPTPAADDEVGAHHRHAGRRAAARRSRSAAARRAARPSA